MATIQSKAALAPKWPERKWFRPTPYFMVPDDAFELGILSVVVLQVDEVPDPVGYEGAIAAAAPALPIKQWPHSRWPARDQAYLYPVALPGKGGVNVIGHLRPPRSRVSGSSRARGRCEQSQRRLRAGCGRRLKKRAPARGQAELKSPP